MVEMIAEATTETVEPVAEVAPVAEGLKAAVNENELHPLESSWDLWYLSADKTKDWDDRLTKLMTFQTVEDFWALYHHVQLPSKLPVGSDYMLFKTGIEPKWEDEQNKDGGKWTLETNKQFKIQLDASWLETLLAVIGEGFEENSSLINGAVVQIRKRVDRLQLWTGKFPADDNAYQVGRKYKSVLNMPEKGRGLAFQQHKDAMTRKGSTITAKYRV